MSRGPNIKGSAVSRRGGAAAWARRSSTPRARDEARDTGDEARAALRRKLGVAEAEAESSIATISALRGEAAAGEAVGVGAWHGDCGEAPGGACDAADALGAGGDVIGDVLHARAGRANTPTLIVRQTTEATSVDVCLR